jgi:hypothetical protein
MKNDCAICNEILGRSGGNLPRALRGTISARFAETKRYVVIPSVGALTPGHSLIVPSDHEHALLPGASISELRELYGKLLLLRGDDPNTVLFAFEHGCTDPGLNFEACGTIHAHLHVMPLPSNVVDHLLYNRTSESMTLGDIATRASGFCRFLAVFQWHDVDSTHGWVAPADLFPSQYMRKKVAEALGIGQWRWQEDMRSDTVSATLALGYRLKMAID